MKLGKGKWSGGCRRGRGKSLRRERVNKKKEVRGR